MNQYLGSYKELIRGFLQKGYDAEFFLSSLNPEKKLIIRHDIDFDCSYAYEMAQIEAEIGVKATYFFLLCSDSYNLLSKENADIVRRIKKSGHSISLHFDPTIYGDNFLNGFRKERGLFEAFFDEQLKIISIHRPTAFFLDYDEPLDDVEHTYQAKFFKEIKYLSDSQGIFRFGHPFKTKEFEKGKTIHLLTHPIWWQCEGMSTISILQNHIAKQQVLFNTHVAKNCIPYQDYLNAR